MNIIAEMTYDGACLGGQVTGAGKVAAGADALTKFTVVEKSSAGYLTKLTATGTPYAIMAEDVDNSEGSDAVGVVVFVKGIFNGKHLISTADLTDAQIDKLRDLGIVVKYGSD